MTHFAGIGLGSTLVPGVVWARMQDRAGGAHHAGDGDRGAEVAGHRCREADRQAMVQTANQNLTRYEEVRKMHIPLDVSPPFHFSALAPGIQVNRTKQPFRLSAAPAVKRPANLEDVAFWPVRHLAELIRTKQVTSVAADRDVSGAAPPLQREAEQRRHLPRRPRDWRRRSRRTPRSPPASTRARCTAFRGARRTSSPSRATRRPGDRRPFKDQVVRLRRERRRDAARRRRGAASRSSRPASWRRAISGSAAGPTARGIRRRDRADRRPDRRRRRRRAASGSPSAPRRADRS